MDKGVGCCALHGRGTVVTLKPDQRQMEEACLKPPIDARLKRLTWPPKSAPFASAL